MLICVCVCVYVLVVKLELSEMSGFHDTAASIGIMQVPQSDYSVCPSSQDYWVVVKHTR